MSLQAVVTSLIAPNQTTPVNYEDSNTREAVRDIVARLNPSQPSAQPAIEGILATRGYNSGNFATDLASFKANDPLGKQAGNDVEVALALVGVPKAQWPREETSSVMATSDFSSADLANVAAAYTRLNGSAPAAAINTPVIAKDPPKQNPTPVSPPGSGVATLEGNPTPTATAIPTGTAVQGAPLAAAQVADALQHQYGTLGFSIGGGIDALPAGTRISQAPSDAKDMDVYANQTELPGDWTVFAHLGLGGQWMSLGSWSSVEATLSQPNGQQTLYEDVASQIETSSSKYRSMGNVAV